MVLQYKMKILLSKMMIYIQVSPEAQPEWRIHLRSFERDPRSEKEATEWCENVVKDGAEVRLWITQTYQAPACFTDSSKSLQVRLWMAQFDSEDAAAGRGGDYLSGE